MLLHLRGNSGVHSIALESTKDMVEQLLKSSVIPWEGVSITTCQLYNEAVDQAGRTLLGFST